MCNQDILAHRTLQLFSVLADDCMHAEAETDQPVRTHHQLGCDCMGDPTVARFGFHALARQPHLFHDKRQLADASIRLQPCEVRFPFAQRCVEPLDHHDVGGPERAGVAQITRKRDPELVRVGREQPVRLVTRQDRPEDRAVHRQPGSQVAGFGNAVHVGQGCAQHVNGKRGAITGIVVQQRDGCHAGTQQSAYRSWQEIDFVLGPDDRAYLHPMSCPQPRQSSVRLPGQSAVDLQ